MMEMKPSTPLKGCEKCGGRAHLEPMRFHSGHEGVVVKIDHDPACF